jgi:hypothetical protein
MARSADVRNPQQECNTHARRSGDRIDVAIESNLTELLAAEVIRLARLATSFHLVEQARLFADAAPDASRSLTDRETSK